MATLLEISGLFNEAVLTAKVAAACLVAAEAVRAESTSTTNHTNRLKWAKAVLSDPAAAGRSMLRAVLAANAGSTLPQINGAADSIIQTAVIAAIDIFADGGA